MKVDLHSHTVASKDSLTTPDQVSEACLRRGIDCLAITDHNRLTALSLSAVMVIPAEEIMTTAGEIIGLFLRTEIPCGLSPLETVSRIKEQGGLVYVPHPFDHFRRSARIRREALEQIAPYVDAVEGLNARNLLAADDRGAREWAAARGLPVGAGSDAHTPGELGAAYVEMDPFTSPAEFLASLKRSRIGGGHSPWWVHLHSTRAKWRKRSQSSPSR